MARSWKNFFRECCWSLDEYNNSVELLRYEQTNRVLARVGCAPTPDWMLFDVDVCIIQAVYLFIIHVVINGCQQTTICIWTESESTRCRSVVRLRDTKVPIRFYETKELDAHTRACTHIRTRTGLVTITHCSRIVPFVWSTIRWRDNQPIVALIGVDVRIV